METYGEETPPTWLDSVADEYVEKIGVLERIKLVDDREK